MNKSFTFKSLALITSAVWVSQMFSCAQQPENTFSKAASASKVLPDPPSNDVSGKSFYLDDDKASTSTQVSTTPASTTSTKPVATTRSTTSAKVDPMAEGKLSTAGGGYWAKPISPAVKGAEDLLQYHDKDGKPQEWYGNYDGANQNTFKMQQSQSGSVDKFVVSKAANTQGWGNATGQYMDANGQPKTLSKDGKVIQSQGFQYNKDGTATTYNWGAYDSQSSDEGQTFKTTGWNLEDGFNNKSGLAVFLPGKDGTESSTPFNVGGMIQSGPGSGQEIKPLGSLLGFILKK